MAEAGNKFHKKGACYACSKCPYKGDKRQMSRHVVMKHLPRQEAPFCCNLCSKVTVRSLDMRKHFDEKHPSQDMLEAIGGTKYPHVLQPSDALAMSKEDSLQFYQFGKAASTNQDSTKSDDATSTASDAEPNSQEIMAMLKLHPNLLEQVQSMVKLQKDVGGLNETPTPMTPPSVSSNSQTERPPSSLNFDTPSSSPITPSPLKKKLKSIIFRKPLTPEAPPKILKPSEKPFSWPTTLPHKEIPSKDQEKSKAETPEIVELHPSDVEISNFLTVKPKLSPLKKTPEKKKQIDESRQKSTKKTSPQKTKSKESDKSKRGKYQDKKSDSKETPEMKDVRNEKEKKQTEKIVTENLKTDDGQAKTEKQGKRDSRKEEATNNTEVKIYTITKKDGTTDKQIDIKTRKRQSTGDICTTSPKQTKSNDKDDVQQVVPLFAVSDLVENSIKIAVDAVASAIIVAAKRQPLPPEQDLRPISNQLLATNTNLAQIGGIMSASNSRNSELSMGVDELVKAANSVSSNLSRMTRALSVFTETTNKLDQHMVEQTSAIRSVIQSSIDAHAGLTSAMQAQAGAFRTIQDRLTTALKPDRSSGQVSSIVKQILKLDDDTTSQTPSPSTTSRSPEHNHKEPSEQDDSHKRSEDRNTYTEKSQDIETRPDNRRQKTDTRRPEFRTPDRRQVNRFPSYRRPLNRQPWGSQVFSNQRTRRSIRRTPEKERRHRAENREN